MKLVTVRCRPILGTDFACKPLYRFKFFNVFLEMWVPHRTAIFKQGANQRGIQLCEHRRVHISVEFPINKAKCSSCLRCNYVNMNRP